MQSRKSHTSVASGRSGTPSVPKKGALKQRKVFKKRKDVIVLHGNMDVTPKQLSAIKVYNPPPKKEKEKAKSCSQSDMMASHSAIGVSIFGTGASAVMLQSHYQTQVTYNATPSCHSVIKTELEYEESWEKGSLLLPSQENVTQDDAASEKMLQIMPDKASIILAETPIVYLLELESTTAEKETEEGNEVEKDNDYYDYLTVGKGRNRKTTNVEVQTNQILLKSRSTIVQREKRKNDHSFASEWDILDTYLNIPSDKSITKKPTKDVSTEPDPSDPEYKKMLEKQQKQMEELLQYPKFQNQCVVMERILASNVFNTEQKTFRGLIEQDPFRPDIAFQYRLVRLWTFQNSHTEGRPVTTMQWNPINKDVLAVGYGKFYYNDNKNGFVYCWNIKNPKQPEREYYFTVPVTTIAFSFSDPNLIAVGLYDGTVNVLDISAKNVTALFNITQHSTLSHDPIWQVIWLLPDDYHPNEEYLVSTCQDGRITRNLLRPVTQEIFPFQLMRVTNIEGDVKGTEHAKLCPVNEIPITRYPAAITISKHSTDKNLYYIGTDEGTVHKCSRNYLLQHIDMFLAHNGPVYTIQFSPFSKKIYLTAGADSNVNIWADSINEPLITLPTPMQAVESAAWSRANSTIIASIAGNNVYLWDIQRRTYSPASVHKNPFDCRNTLVQFTKSGRNLVVSDIEGNVHIYALEDMPFPPFYQEDMLAQVILKNLVTRKELLKKLRNVLGCASPSI